MKKAQMFTTFFKVGTNKTESKTIRTAFVGAVANVVDVKNNLVVIDGEQFELDSSFESFKEVTEEVTEEATEEIPVSKVGFIIDSEQ